MFHVVDTRAVYRPRSLRGDIDVVSQLQSERIRRHTAIFNANMVDYEKTVITKDNHEKFLDLLVSEVRHFHLARTQKHSTVTVDPEEESTAISSVNRHGTVFTPLFTSLKRSDVWTKDVSLYLAWIKQDVHVMMTETNTVTVEDGHSNASEGQISSEPREVLEDNYRAALEALNNQHMFRDDFLRRAQRFMRMRRNREVLEQLSIKQQTEE